MASLKEIIQDLAQGDDSELLVMSFDIGTTRCEWPIRTSRATPTEVYLFVSRLESLAGVAIAYIAPKAQGW
jgi:hypothetical protein